MTTRRTVHEIAEESVKGSTEVFISQLTAAIVSAFGIVIIARGLGPALFGEIAVVMILPSLAVILTDWAVSHAITRHVALFRTNGQTERIWGIVKAGVLFEISVGIIMTILSAILAQYFAIMSLGRANLIPLIVIASWTILGQTMLVAAKSILIGMDRTKRFGLIIISSSFLQGLLPAIFVFYGFGVYGAILGMTLGSLLLGVLALLTLGGVISRKGTSSNDTRTLSIELKLLLSYSLPVFIAVVAASALPQILYVIGANYLTPWDLGNYSAAIRLGGLMTFVSLPILTVIFPAFSKIQSDERREDLKSLYIQGTKYTAFIVVPLTGLIISIANPVIQILYGNEYSATPLYLAIYLITYFYSIIGSLTVGGFLRGQGQTRIYLGMHIILLSSGSILGIILTPLYGAIGLIISNVLSTFLCISSGIIWVSNHYGYKPSSITAVKTLFSVVFSILISSISIIVSSTFSMLIQSLVGTIVFGIAYFLISGMIQLIDYEDFKNLKNLFESLGSLGVPIIYILEIYRKLTLRDSSHVNLRNDRLRKQNQEDLIERYDSTIGLLPDNLSSILDVGSAEGKLTSRIGIKNPIIGVDISLEALKKSEIDVVLASITNLPFNNNEFNCVLCTEVLEHLSQNGFRAAINEIERVSEKWILISVPFREDLDAGRIFCEFCGSSFHVWGHRRCFEDLNKLDFFPSYNPVRMVPIQHRYNGSLYLSRFLSRGKHTNVYQKHCPYCRRKSKPTSFSFHPRRFLEGINGIIITLKIVLRLSEPRWIAILYEKK